MNPKWKQIAVIFSDDYVNAAMPRRDLAIDLSKCKTPKELERALKQLFGLTKEILTDTEDYTK